MISLIDLPAAEAMRKRLRLDPQVLRAVRTAQFKRFAADGDALAAVPAACRAAFAEEVAWHPLALHDRRDSARDGATKLLFRTERGALLESVVLRIATGRTSLCISSQVGCAAKCEFCATGHMGFVQNLSPAEMLDQLVQAGQLLAAEGRKVRNLVFMGMGEPLHNEAALYEALRALLHPQLFHHPPSRVLVSTVGIPDAMIRCARRFPQVNLALSLHSVDAETRGALIPLARKHPLDELRRALGQINAVQPPQTSVMIEYLMLEGVNDALDAAQSLADWLHGLRVHVNLIPYNPIDAAPRLRATPRAQRDAFAGVLRAAGFPTTIRYSLGNDIAAACGQLVRERQAGR